MKRTKTFAVIASVFAFALCAVLVFDAQKIIEASERSVYTCLSVIIPSLFAFMVFSQIIISSGIADILFFPMYKISKFWFKGNRRLFSIFMLSLIGGYPIGIKLLKEYTAYNKNYTAIAEKMLCYCYCGSPAFIIQIAGLSVFGSSFAGLIIYLSNITSCVIFAVLSNIFEKRDLSIDKYTPEKISFSLQTIVNSINSAVKTLGIICGTIVAFNIFIEICDYIGILNIFKLFNLDKFLSAFLEISNLSLLKGVSGNTLYACSMLTSFGGLCIILQTASLSGGKIKLKKFILARIPIALLSGLMCRLYSFLFGFSVESLVSSPVVPMLSDVNPLFSVCIIIMSYIIIKTHGDVSKSVK